MRLYFLMMAVLFCLNAVGQSREGLQERKINATGPIYYKPYLTISDLTVIDTLPSFRDTLPVIMMVTSMRNSGETKSIWAKLGYRLYKGKHMYFTNQNYEPFPEYLIVWDYKRKP